MSSESVLGLVNRTKSRRTAALRSTRNFQTAPRSSRNCLSTGLMWTIAGEIRDGERGTTFDQCRDEPPPKRIQPRATEYVAQPIFTIRMH